MHLQNHLCSSPAEQQIEAAANEGCTESRLLLTRRAMLGVTAGLFTSAFLPSFASASTDPDARLLVVFLRGGMDGIGMVVPKLDSHYESVRRQLALPFSATLSLGSDFALHPALSRVHKMFQAGDAAIVPAAGIPLRNRSHFECQDNLESGLPGPGSYTTGWLNRLLASLPAGDPIRKHRGIEIGEAPLILRGPEPVLGWSPTWFSKATPENIARVEENYTALDPQLWSSLQRGLEADQLALAAGTDTSSSISTFRKAFIGAGRLMRAASGPRVAVLSVEGWDTHADQGGLKGLFNDRLKELDQALGDLKSQLGNAWEKTVVVCVTEFGRTVNTNGDDGTDHGVGTVALLVGGALKGGIYGDWPGLAAKHLYEGVDLKPTVDLRSVFKGVLVDHLGVPSTVLNTNVFPDSSAVKPLPGLIRGTSSAARMTQSALEPVALREETPISKYRKRYGTSG
jgi:uncharacterized protein (DUF1501 family)